ncbi:thermonuclease family protein [Synechococcus sp. MIT S9451]|uniref:thermonuclease family protein n=1 Tax=Synechococcus sp. MIT S9451 TaxID=3082543 RepID=UPI0039B4F5F4
MQQSLLSLLLLAAPAWAYPSVTIKSCWDGDTCTTAAGEKIRLACIGTPELTGPRADPVAAKAARGHLRRMVVGKQVEIRRITKDRYGRTVGELFLAGPHITRLNVQREMVASGHAVVIPKYAKQCPWAD